MNKVTIMIPTFNQAQYIEQCINSVLVQEYSNLEVIISDDSINNETEKIIKEKYLNDSRVIYFHNIPALGRVGNYRKTLFERATGDFVLNLDGDDWLIDTSYISKAVRILEEHKNVVCVFSNQVNYYQNENKFVENNANKCLEEINEGNNLFFAYPYEKISLNHLSNIYRREDAISIDYYRQDIISSDRESFLRLILGKKVGFINGVAGAWRIHGNNESSPDDIMLNIIDMNFVDSVYGYATEKFSFDEKMLLEWKINLKKKILRSFFAPTIREKNTPRFLKLFVLIAKYDFKLVFHIGMDLSVRGFQKGLDKLNARLVKLLKVD